MPIKVLKAGLATSVQDLGRPGYYSLGVPPSGNLDQRSALIANLLVGNDESCAVLEAPFLGPELRFDADTVVAVTGGESKISINGEPAEQWAPISVQKGDVLATAPVSRGARLYIAVAGGIDVPEVLDSRSTYALGAFGGYKGRVLEEGDALPVGEPQGAPNESEVPERWRPQISKSMNIRIVLGLYDYRLTERGLASFIDSEWMLTPTADRIGFRYKGPQLEWVEREQPFGAGSDLSNVTDSGYPIGSIQVPGGIEPIMLHRDAVSGGGYATIATLINADFDTVGQCPPGTMVRFVPVSIDEALDAWREYQREREEIRAAFSA